MEGDREVIEILNQIVDRKPQWGFWNLYDRRRPDGYRITHKRLYRLYCTMKRNLPRCARHRLPGPMRQLLQAPPGLNQICALDFIADALRGGRLFRTLNTIDEGNRQTQRIEMHGRPRALRLHNGTDFISVTFTHWREDHKIAPSHIEPAKSHQNASIERFDRPYDEEVLDAHLLDSLKQVCEITES
jgi:putative transposase